MKNKNIFIALGIGVLAYLLIRPRITQLTTQRPATIPPQYYNAPPRGTAAFQNWANTLLQVYGQSKWLFEPGGPFYKNKIMDTAELNKVLKQPIVDIPTGRSDYGDYG